jgi:hypothetical protein
MLGSLLLKEWLKMKRFFVALILLNLGFCIKIFLDIRQQMHSEHAEMVWYQVIHIHTLLYQDIRYLPLVSGVILAISQFIPEINGRRMRISLHLPIDRNRMLLVCLAIGMLLFLSIAICDVGFIYCTLRLFFPLEVATSTFSTLAPWLIAGIFGYLGTVTILLESSLRRRIFLLLVFSTLITLCFNGFGYGWFTPALWYLGSLVPLMFFAVFESARRFQQGSG